MGRATACSHYIACVTAGKGRHGVGPKGTLDLSNLVAQLIGYVHKVPVLPNIAVEHNRLITAFDEEIVLELRSKAVI